MAKIQLILSLHERSWRAWLSDVLVRGMACISVIFGIVLFFHAQKNSYAYVPAMAMVGIPCIQGLRQYRSNWLARRWIRNFHRVAQEDDMMQQILMVHGWTDVPTSWPAPCRTTIR